MACQSSAFDDHFKVAALSKELRATIADASAGARHIGSRVDDLRARREKLMRQGR